MEKVSPKLLWGIVIALIIGSIIVAGFGPPEKTLGTGIRVVYVHVALTWVGMLSLVLAGVLGIIVFLTANGRLGHWMQTIGWVGFAFYVGGTAVSTIASKVNWGAVFWREPRMMAALNVIAFGIIIHAAALWLTSTRVRGFLNLLLAAILLWLTYGAPLVLHPREAISTSNATGIQMTFLAMFAIYGATAVILTWLWQQNRPIPVRIDE